MNHLAIITSNYPSPANPTHGTFVRQFARAVARQGVKVSVIQPVAWHRALRWNSYPYHEREAIVDGSWIDIYRPRFLSLSARDAFNKLGVFSPSRMTLHQFTAAVRRTLQRQKLTADALYGHFLFMAGAAAVRIGQERGIPAFPCAGEGEFWTVRRYGLPYAIKALGPATGILANSTALKRQIHEQLQMPLEKINVFPNGADLSTFKPVDQAEARKQLRLPQDKFLVCAVGNFLHKKGIARVGESIDGLEGVAGVFAGSGPVPPLCRNIAFCGKVPHADMPVLMSACDVFVLPTLIEGSCNAIVEAMACGLPIVSSIGEFNDDLLDDSMAIRVDPLDIEAIRNAILQLKNDIPMRICMRDNAVKKAQQFDVNDRARRILTFISERKSQISAARTA